MKEYIVDTVYGDTYCKKVYGDEGLPKDLLSELSTEEIEVLSGCRIEPSTHHGSTSIIHGFAKLKEPVTVWACHTLVTTPYIKYSFEIYRECKNGDITNNMSCIELCAPTDCLLEGEDARLHRKIEQLIGHEAGCWGSKAFWDHTPIDSLTGPDLIVRKFIEQVVRTSKKHRWVAQAKKQWKDLSEGNERPLTM